MFLRTIGCRMTSKGPIHTSIEHKIRTAFAPVKLVIDDQSHMHRGHAGVQGTHTKETHFSVDIISDHFNGMNRVQRQRAVNALLKQEFEEGLHALSLSCKTTKEE
jgi:stress-induced morphogen